MALMWGPVSQHNMTYNEALLYCQFYNHRGYNDWRMPTQKEIIANLWQPPLGQHTWYLEVGTKFPTMINKQWDVRPVRDATGIKQNISAMLIYIEHFLEYMFKG
jgi:hypothetical protein